VREDAVVVIFTGVDRLETAVNASQVTYITPVSDGTRIRFSEGRSVTVIEPLAAVVDALNHQLALEHA
jgi:hypothetical protein